MGKFNQIVKQIMITLIKGYRYCLSPLLGRQCRFYPTCSHYAEQAINEHGIFYGFYLTIRRLLRCHPWHQGGYDPVQLNKHNGQL